MSPRKPPAKPKKNRRTTKSPRRSAKKPPDYVARRVAGESLASIARSCKAAEKTVAVWEAESAVEIENLRANLAEEGKRKLFALQPLAIEALGDVLTKGACEKCGRSPAQDKDRLKASELIFDRTGLHRTEGREHSGSVVTTGDPAADERVVLEEAAWILQERGMKELAAQVLAEAKKR